MADVLKRRRRRLAAITVVAVVLAGVAAAGMWLWNPASAQEAARLVESIGIQPGMTVGEIGAGDGTTAFAVARSVGPEGHVYANELSPNSLAEMRQSVAEAGLGNVTVIEGSVDGTNVPEECCDVIYMRHVYHHFTEESLDAMLASLRASIRPGGTLAVIDFPPSRILGAIAGRLDEVPEDRRGHGIPVEVLVKEVTDAGFAHAETVERWSRRSYLVVFTRAVPRSEEPGLQM